MELALRGRRYEIRNSAATAAHSLPKVIRQHHGSAVAPFLQLPMGRGRCLMQLVRSPPESCNKRQSADQSLASWPEVLTPHETGFVVTPGFYPPF